MWIIVEVSEIETIRLTKGDLTRPCKDRRPLIRSSVQLDQYWMFAKGSGRHNKCGGL